MRWNEVVATASVMDHAVRVTDVADRRDLFRERCAGRRVLHVGCADVPVFDPETNLHIYLARQTDRLDGLDVSAEGIANLRRYVAGSYYLSIREVCRPYDVVLAPEVLEHTLDPHSFLRDLFSVRARQYLITAPHVAWYTETRREGGLFFERVHADHRAWYSPYTLLNTVRPFVDEATDDLEVFLFAQGVSVGVAVSKQVDLEEWPPAPPPSEHQGPAPAPGGCDVRGDPLEAARARLAVGDPLGAMQLIVRARSAEDTLPLLIEHMRMLRASGQNMEALRQGVGWMRRRPNDRGCLEACADAAEALGHTREAAQWRATARGLR